MDASDSKIDDIDIVAERLGAQTPDNLDAEPVIAEKNIADAGDEHPHYIALMRR
jgi:hypothetical protein